MDHYDEIKRSFTVPLRGTPSPRPLPINLMTSPSVTGDSTDGSHGPNERLRVLVVAHFLPFSTKRLGKNSNNSTSFYNYGSSSRENIDACDIPMSPLAPVHNNDTSVPPSPEKAASLMHPFQQLSLSDGTLIGEHQPSSSSSSSSSSPSSSSSSTASALNASSQTAHTPGSTRGKWGFQARRGHTALYAGTSSLKENYDIVHVGWDESLVEGMFSSEEVEDLRERLWNECHQCVPVVLKESTALNHYDGYCKKVLWPILHYILWDPVTDGDAEKKYWKDYVDVNEAFADAICKIYRPGDIS